MSIAVLILFGAVVILLAVGASVFASWVLRKIEAGPDGELGTEDDIDISDYEVALKDQVYRAVLAGYHAEKLALDQIDAKLSNADKAAIANKFYDLIPDFVSVAGVPIPVGEIKLIVTRDVFETWVKNAYDAAHAVIVKNEAYLHSKIEAFNPAN
jgi:hypothetical protein